MSDDIAYQAHLAAQFEVLWKHLEYHDSNVLKILSIYFGFSGLFLANIERFKESEVISSILVTVVSSIFSVLLYRTSNLLTEFKIAINKIDAAKSVAGLHMKSIPESYLNSKLRTSVIGYISIPIFAMAIILTLFNILNS